MQIGVEVRGKRMITIALREWDVLVWGLGLTLKLISSACFRSSLVFATPYHEIVKESGKDNAKESTNLSAFQ
jgi:hypothetical protein